MKYLIAAMLVFLVSCSSAENPSPEKSPPVVETPERAPDVEYKDPSDNKSGGGTGAVEDGECMFADCWIIPDPKDLDPLDETNQ